LAIRRATAAKNVDASKAMGSFNGWTYAAVNAIAREVSNIRFRPAMRIEARRAAVRSAGRSAREARLIAEPMSIGRLQLFDLIEDSSHFPAQRRAVVLVDFLEHRAPQPRAGVL
jgi:hypothetical protein